MGASVVTGYILDNRGLIPSRNFYFCHHVLIDSGACYLISKW
jgi:hypothetical protein